MTRPFQLGWIAAAAALVLHTGVVFAQQPNKHPDRPPQQQAAPRKNNAGNAPRPNAAPAPRNNTNTPQRTNPNPNTANPNRPPANAPANRAYQQNYSNNNVNPNRPPASTIGPARENNYRNYNDRPNANQPGVRLNPRQQVGAGAPRPFVDQMRDLSPRDRERVLQSSKSFQEMSPDKQNRIRQQFNQWDRLNPQQRADLRSKEDTWRRMTPDQRDYVKNNVLPRWKQIPWGRQQVIQQKLSVLQNMPESARNQRLSDPNFTRGMSDEDRATLHELSHLHVGGAPDPPSNEP